MNIVSELIIKQSNLLLYIHENYIVIKSNPNMDEVIKHEIIRCDNNKYIITNGEYESNHKYEMYFEINKIQILGTNTKVLLYRNACDDKKLEIKIKKYNVLYLEGFDDIYPEMDITCKGIIKTRKENPFVVGNLTIKMGADYVNESCIENFQVSDNISLLYMYNGSIIGTRELNAKYHKPEPELCGRGIFIEIKKITKEEQQIIDACREKLGYKTLSQNRREIQDYRQIKKLNQTKDDLKKCLKCPQDIETTLIPCHHSVYCFNCVREESHNYNSNLKPPYLKCPICGTYVNDIKMF